MAKKKSVKKAATKGFVKAKAAANATGPEGVRADKGADASVAIERMAEPQRSIARATDKLIRKVVPGTTGVVKWGNPVYQAEGRSFCALMETKSGVNLALPGMKLADPEKLLEGTGKTMRHVKLHSLEAVKRPAVAALVKGAVGVGLDRM
ncbi:MAG: DUF1801 domain-containing protein [Phycisphaerales bacterium]